MLGMAVFLSSAFAAEPASDKYLPNNVQNISNALFKIGVLRASDPLAVDEYIRIHHCGLYEQYGSNDISWTRIREAQSRELALLAPTLNENLEVEGSMSLGNYDFAVSRFPLTGINPLVNAGLIGVADITNGSYEPCSDSNGKNFVPRAHPFRLTARLSQPVNLPEIPVSKAIADQILKIINNRKTSDSRQDRSVLLVMRLHLTGPDLLSGSTNSSNLTVTGDLDDLKIYDGPDRKLLLYSKDFRDPKAAKTGRQ